MNTRSCGLLILGLGLVGTAYAQDIDHGKALFDTNCQNCHRAGPNSLKTPPDELAGKLMGNQVRSHWFKLSEADVQAIVAYLGNLPTPK